MTDIPNRNWIYREVIPTLLLALKTFSEKEKIMSTLTAASPIQTTSSYLSNVGHAASALVHALFAVAPNETTAESHVTARDLHNLYCMANRCDSVLPNLAQELRVIAARAY